MRENGRNKRRAGYMSKFFAGFKDLVSWITFPALQFLGKQIFEIYLRKQFPGTQIPGNKF